MSSDKMLAFRDLVYKHYSSDKEFLNALGWKKRKLVFMINGFYEATDEDLEMIANKLHCDLEYIKYIFKDVKTPF